MGGGVGGLVSLTIGGESIQIQSKEDLAFTDVRRRLVGKPGCRYLVGVVGGGAAALDAVRGHHGSQVVSLHQQLVQVPAALLVDVDDGSGHLGDALDHHLQREGGGGGAQSATVKTEVARSCNF